MMVRFYRLVSTTHLQNDTEIRAYQVRPLEDLNVHGPLSTSPARELLARADHLLDTLHLSLEERRVAAAVDALQRSASLLRAPVLKVPVGGLGKEGPDGEEDGHEDELEDDDGLVGPHALDEVCSVRNEPCHRELAGRV